jgi:membrane associated rhomboid family serine protease
MPMDSDRKREFFFYQPAFFGRRAQRRSGPRLTVALIAICAVAFVIDWTFSISDYLAFTPAYAFAEPWTFVTSIFMHAGPEHLFFNMFALYMFGIYLEARVQPEQFLFIFFAAGILGNAAYWLTDPLGTIPAVGASGAIYGVMGMLAVLYPGLTVYVGFAPMPMIFAAVLWFVLEFTGMFTPSDIAHSAHLAGLVAGAAYGFYVRRQRSRPVYFWEK